MPINYLEIKPSANAIKTIYGWQDKNTGELLVSAYGYFANQLDNQEPAKESKQESKQEPVVADNQPNHSAVLYPVNVALEGESMENGESATVVIGTLKIKGRKKASVELIREDSEGYSIALFNDGEVYSNGEHQIAAVITKTADGAIDIAETLKLKVDNQEYTADILASV